MELIHGDNLIVEDDKAWFVAVEMNMLFQADLKTNEGKCIAVFPDFRIPDFRRNSRILKSGENIYCFPDFGDVIWVYNLRTKVISNIEIANPLKCRVAAQYFQIIQKEIYVVSFGLKTVIEISTEQKKVLNYYKMPFNEAWIGEVCYIDKNKIYFIIESKFIYEFNIDLKLWKKYELPEINAKLWTITYDKGNFWLSGYSKEIFVWNKFNKSIKVLKDFPNGIGQYNFENNLSEIIDYKSEEFSNPLFSNGVNSEKYIWFIARKSNQILYVDKKTYKINKLYIEDENEDLKSLVRKYTFKYATQYYTNDGKLGLYSYKMNAILEVDTNNLSWKYKKIKVDKGEILDQIIKNSNYRLFKESDWSLYDLLMVDKHGISSETNIAKQIHKSVM